VSPVRYELGSYIPDDDILHSDRRENLKSYRSPFGSYLVAAGTGHGVWSLWYCGYGHSGHARSVRCGAREWSRYE
jgi:hypothetical protein